MDVSMKHDTRRRFEQWARNPGCEANTISAVQGVSMVDVATSEGTRPSLGQSPFAIKRGQDFESLLFSDDAALLRRELVASGGLPGDAEGVVDCRLHSVGGSLRDLAVARKKTEIALRKIAQLRHRRQVTSMIAGATVSVPGTLMLPDALLVIDVLVVRYGGKRPELMVGEIKTYPDRGGYTDPTELATARAQAGVYVHALDLAIDKLGLGGEVIVSTEGFLVLTRPGSNQPVVRPREDLRYQAVRAQQGFALLRAAAESMPAESGEGADPLEVVRQADIEYHEGCLSFCDRAPLCHRRALARGAPSVLGESVAEALGPLSLHRALELLDGASPDSEAEQELASQLARVRGLLP